MSTNKTTKPTPTPAQRFKAAIARTLTNIRQLLELEPTDQTIALIEQHTDLINSLYKLLASCRTEEATPVPVSQTEITDQSHAHQPTTTQVENIAPSEVENIKILPQSHDLTPSRPISRQELLRLPSDHPLVVQYQRDWPQLFKKRSRRK